jgi:hypothetical protein
MPSKKVCIVVPIYLEEPTALEKIGLAQILKVFKNYDIIFQVSNGIQTKWYEEFSQGKANFQFREFAVNNFIEYNKLLLSPDFFERFADYEFMLICHMDAFPFRDELAKWCGRNYDIIGSIIYSHQFHMTPTITRIFGLGAPQYMFNGGFCLYRVEGLRRLLSSLSLKHRLYFLYHRIRRKGNYPLSDIFISQLVPKTRGKFQVAPKSEAEKFGVNLADDWDTKQVPFADGNVDSLPSGVHGWYRWHIEFWKPYIRAFGHEI